MSDTCVCGHTEVMHLWWGKVASLPEVNGTCAYFFQENGPICPCDEWHPLPATNAGEGER
ncbi:MAG: hypothetical protein Q8R28_14235 [Dehalococcoidia bacterium]|nr:hypothetical protein [Dehalococcoidia bacterium]